MNDTINIGIDLGTTNSAIGFFSKGDVQIFKDPVSWKDTMPSVVSFKKDRIIIGAKAKEMLERAPQNTIGLFKRKMGTNESFIIKNINKSVTPIELSSYVLKELKTFVQDTNINLDSVVITIPASFDTIQSNATKQAGELAGFKEVILLQEPIAASLAYANTSKEDLDNTKWLVYDLGGGTFDVALLNISDGQMKVIDHEGDNFLGGSDFDRLIIEKIIIKHLENKYGLTNLKEEMQNSSGKYNKIYHRLLKLAEDVKIELSSKTSAEIELNLGSDDGVEIDDEITITRSEFEAIIKPEIIKTVELIKNMLTKNSLMTTDIDFILMIGGSTYIPYIKSYIQDTLQIRINADIDPTTAVCVGASIYAGNKKRNIQTKQNSNSDAFVIKMAYEKSSKDDNEYFAAKIENFKEGYSYKITRDDGGFDSGLKQLLPKISEDLPLVKDTYNFFNFTIYDSFNNKIQSQKLEISQGKYNIAGQPLPEDICLEIDDTNNQGTKLELIFQKNSILPTKKTITKEINKTIKRDSNDAILINVLEGDSNSIPSANKNLGFIKISGKDLSRDILKNSDLELCFEMSESRDLKISAYISMSDQTFTETFNPRNRSVNFSDLSNQAQELSDKLSESLDFAEENHDYKKIDELYEIQKELEDIKSDLEAVDEDNTTDIRYQLEDKKREIATKYYNIIKDENLNIAKKEYTDLKPKVELEIGQYGDYNDKELLKELNAKEEAYLHSNNLSKIKELLDELYRIYFNVNWKKPEFIKEMFLALAENDNFIDSSRANMLIGNGLKYLEREDYEELSQITRKLFALVNLKDQTQLRSKIGFY